MSTLPVLLSLGTATAISGTLVLDTSRKMIRRSLALRRSPPTDLSRIKAGPVTVRGEVVPVDYLKGVLSNRSGLASRLIVERWLDGARGEGGSWKVFLDIAESRPFFIQSRGQRVRVEATYIDLDVPLSGEILQASALELPAHLSDLFEAHNAQLRLWPSPTLIRCREYLLQPADVVTVCGEAVLKASPGEGPYRTGQREISIREGSWGNVLISDRTREALVRRYNRRLMTGLGLLGVGLAEAAAALLIGF